MRLLIFLCVGTFIGGGSAAILGLAFGSGYAETMAMELTIYVVVGIIGGFFLGLVTHLLTYRRVENVGSASPIPGLGAGFGGFNSGVAGGIILMFVAVLWFVMGYFAAHRIYFYPPVMFLIGLVAFVKGILAAKY